MAVRCAQERIRAHEQAAIPYVLYTPVLRTFADADLTGDTRVLPVFAAAFFLLGNSLKDAVNVCIRQLDDLQLAIVLARTYEGDNGPVLRALLEETVLPLAFRDGQRWLATWALWMLGRRDLAIQAVIVRHRSGGSARPKLVYSGLFINLMFADAPVCSRHATAVQTRRRPQSSPGGSDTRLPLCAAARLVLTDGEGSLGGVWQDRVQRQSQHVAFLELRVADHCHSQFVLHIARILCRMGEKAA